MLSSSAPPEDLFQSVVLSASSSSTPVVQKTKNDYLIILKEILHVFFDANASPAKIESAENALNELVNQQFVLEIKSKLIAAYKALYTACLSNDKTKLAESFSAIHKLPIPALAQQALLDIKIQCDPNESHLTSPFNFLQIASRNRQHEMVEALLREGADPMTRRPDLANCSIRNFFPFALFDVIETTYIEEIGYFGRVVRTIIPFDDLKKHIQSYLNFEFDITAKHNNKNLLEHAYAFCKFHEHTHSDTLYHPVLIIVHGIVKLFDDKKISEKQFKEFCETTTILKRFPILVSRYKKCSNPKPDLLYQNETQEKFYRLYALFYSLLGFCNYQLQRMDHSNLYWVSSSGKSNALKGIIQILWGLQLSYFNENTLTTGNLTELDLITNDLNKIVTKLPSITQMPRLGLFGSSVVTSSTEWQAFCKDHEEELKIVDIPIQQPNVVATGQSPSSNSP